MKPLEAYDIFREMHKQIREVWKKYPRGEGLDDHIENAFDAVDNALYLAEQSMVQMQIIGDFSPSQPSIYLERESSGRL